jgi:hypothetical protein
VRGEKKNRFASLPAPFLRFSTGHWSPRFIGSMISLHHWLFGRLASIMTFVDDENASKSTESLDLMMTHRFIHLSWARIYLSWFHFLVLLS